MAQPHRQLPPAWPTPTPPPRKRRLNRTVLIVLVTVLGTLAALTVAGVIVSVAAGPNTKTATAISPAAPAAVNPAGFTPPASAPPDSAPPAENPAMVGAVGDTAAISQDGHDAATITITGISTAKVEPGEFGATPDRGMFLIVKVTAKGTGAAVDVNPLDFHVTGADGTHYEDPSYSTAWGPSFEAGTLTAGEHISGTLVYDVNTAAKHGKLVYAPNFNGEPVATWNF